MFGLEILDIAIGLAFVYLLLSLVCTAVNEYIASMLNKRGKELVRGIDHLLGGNPELKEAFYSHPLISSLYPPGGRKPSYLPARSFALALLSVTDYARRIPGASAAPAAGSVATPAWLEQALDTLRTDSAADVSELLLAPEMAPVLANETLPPEVRRKLVGLAVGSESELHKLQDSVEVWFNNSMDRVSGGYKRYTQVALFFIGMALAFAVNADTLHIWRTLAVDDELRGAMVRRAATLVDSMDARLIRGDTAPARAAAPRAAGRTPGDTASVGPPGAAPDAAPTVGPPGATLDAAPTAGPADSARDTSRAAVLARGVAPPAGAPSTDEAERLLRAARAELDRTGLSLGWSWAEAGRLGVARPETPADPGGRWVLQSPAAWHWSAVLGKLLGLLLTGIALSLGAPFWFDTLNRFVNVRGAGRAPDEKPRSPEAPAKRAAERAAR